MTDAEKVKAIADLINNLGESPDGEITGDIETDKATLLLCSIHVGKAVLAAKIKQVLKA